MADDKVERKKKIFAFDIEGSGADREKNQLLSLGWMVNGKEMGQVALYLGKREEETFEDLWRRHGFDMDCYKWFKERRHILLPFQVPPGKKSHSFENEDQFSQKEYVVYSDMLDFLFDDDDLLDEKEDQTVVIQATSYEQNKKNLLEWKESKFDKLRAKYTPVFYIRVYTERELAFVIHEVLIECQKNLKLYFISDTLHYDASWVDKLLGQYGHPPLLHDQAGRPGYEFMCWGRELGSFQMGLCAAGIFNDESGEQYSKTKDWIESQITNGWEEKNSHFALDDSMKINGSWKIVERENAKRFAFHKRVAASIRQSEGHLTELTESLDPTPNWKIVDEWLQENVEELCKLASSSKRQRVRK